jgi:hypothetical protein
VEADWAPLEGRKALNAWCDAREVWARENLVDPEHDDPYERDIICENVQMRRRAPMVNAAVAEMRRGIGCRVGYALVKVRTTSGLPTMPNVSRRVAGAAGRARCRFDSVEFVDRRSRSR